MNYRLPSPMTVLSWPSFLLTASIKDS